MLHLIKADRKVVGRFTYFLNIDSSGGITNAEITYTDGKKWFVKARESGKKAEENVMFMWKRI